MSPVLTEAEGAPVRVIVPCQPRATGAVPNLPSCHVPYPARLALRSGSPSLETLDVRCPAVHASHAYPLMQRRNDARGFAALMLLTVLRPAIDSKGAPPWTREPVVNRRELAAQTAVHWIHAKRTTLTRQRPCVPIPRAPRHPLRRCPQTIFDHLDHLRSLDPIPVTGIRRFALVGRLLDEREHPHMNSSTGRSTVSSAVLLGGVGPQWHGGTGPR